MLDVCGGVESYALVLQVGVDRASIGRCEGQNVLRKHLLIESGVTPE